MIPYQEADTNLLACLSKSGKLHLFPLNEIKMLAGGGKGMITMALDAQDALSTVAVSDGSTLVLSGVNSRGKPLQLTLDANDLAPYIGKRARRGKPINTGFKFC